MTKAVKLSKPFYLVALLGLHALGSLQTLAYTFFDLVPTERAVPLVFISNAVLTIGFIIVFLFFWYRAWKAVYSPDVRYTPANRALNLLLPIYHLYWCFKVFWEWGKRYNEYLKKNGLALSPVKEPIFLIFSIYFAASMTMGYAGFIILFFRDSPLIAEPLSSYITVALEVIYYVIEGGTIYYVCNAVNRLAAVPAEPEAD